MALASATSRVMMLSRRTARARRATTVAGRTRTTAVTTTATAATATATRGCVARAATTRATTRGRGCAVAARASEGPTFVTTPIYYVNDQPHIGHVYTSTVADAYARYRRARGEDVFFLTGTDEHGLKGEQSAEKRGIEPQALADENGQKYRDVMTAYDISFAEPMRRTGEYSAGQVRLWVEEVQEHEEDSEGCCLR